MTGASRSASAMTVYAGMRPPDTVQRTPFDAERGVPAVTSDRVTAGTTGRAPALARTSTPPPVYVYGPTDLPRHAPGASTGSRSAFHGDADHAGLVLQRVYSEHGRIRHARRAWDRP